jgi:hypothetical protein
VTSREEGERHIITLTSEGRAQVEERGAGLGDLFADFADAPTRPDPPDRLGSSACCGVSDRGRRRRHTAPGRRERQPAGAAVAAFDLGREAEDVGE